MKRWKKIYECKCKCQTSKECLKSPDILKTLINLLSGINFLCDSFLPFRYLLFSLVLLISPPSLHISRIAFRSDARIICVARKEFKRFTLVPLSNFPASLYPIPPPDPTPNLRVLPLTGMTLVKAQSIMFGCINCKNSLGLTSKFIV